MSPTTSSLHRDLAVFVAGLTYERLSSEVITKVRTNMLHDLSCAMAAYDVATPAWELASELGPGEATLLCSGARAPAEMAAFANGVRLHARAQDDTHFAAKSHAGSIVLAATLAVAQKLGASGRDVLVAVVAGYETIGAVGELLAAQVTARGFRASSVFGPLGAAASVAKLLALDVEGTANAIAIATSFSGGLNQTWIDGSTEWRWEVGMAARNGVVAARLAAGGAHGAAHAFEGAAGFAAAFAGESDFTYGPLELGRRWRILDVVYKPHPVCNITQSAVTVSAGLARDYDLQPSDVASVRCYLNPADRSYPGTLNAGPFLDVGGTLMSAPFCVAMALRDRRATLRGLARFDDSEMLELIARIEILPDEGLPVLSARVEIMTTDGRKVGDELIPDASTYNWSWDETATRVDALRAEMANLGAGIDALKEALLHLEELCSIDALLEATVAT